MHSAVCIECGAIFDAQRNTAKYCSNACKLRHRRNRGVPLVPEDAPRIEAGADEVDVARAIAAARGVAGGFAQLSVHGPYQLRAGCVRVGEAISGALDAEGW